MTDALRDLVELLAADVGVSAAVEGRIAGGRLPRAESAGQPRKCLVARYSGNPGGPGSRDDLKLVEFRVDCEVYGETHYEADVARREVFRVLRDLRRRVEGTTLFHRALHSGGPIHATDRDTGWPFVLDSWDVLIAREQV